MVRRKFGPHGIPPVREAYANGVIAGWHARGRVEQLTKARRAVVEAAIRCHNRDFRDGVNALVKAIANLERARRKA